MPPHLNFWSSSATAGQAPLMKVICFSASYIDDHILLSVFRVLETGGSRQVINRLRDLLRLRNQLRQKRCKHSDVHHFRQIRIM